MKNFIRFGLVEIEVEFNSLPVVVMMAVHMTSLPFSAITAPINWYCKLCSEMIINNLLPKT